MNAKDDCYFRLNVPRTRVNNYNLTCRETGVIAKADSIMWNI